MRIVNITYFVHGTTIDNENDIASGWYDVELSELGRRQSVELKGKIRDKKFDVVYCSDLKRAVDSTTLTFGKTTKIIKDQRLRECNYGDFTRRRDDEMRKLTLEHVDKPFPNGESYKDVEKRVRSFLKYLLKEYSGKEVGIVSHRGPQLALDVILKNKTWEHVIKEDWRLKNPPEWKPGWNYSLKGNLS
jgi:broad specificity phosphatase PhoE